MPVYEFMCSKGHVSEDLVSVGTKTVACQPCIEEMKVVHRIRPRGKSIVCGTWCPTATRILSPTRTDFEFADSRRKRSFV